MSIIVNLDVMLAKRKMKLKDLSKKVGISVVNLSVLKQGKGKAIRFSTLDAICDTLDCQPANILKHVKKPKMKFIKNKSVSLSYLEKRNNISDQWVLFIPGAINSAEQISEDLKNASFNYYILSLRGRGKSDSPDSGYSLEDQASDIESFIAHINKDTELTVFAHSVGVPISIVALSKISKKIKSFIMCEFAPFYPPFDKNWSDSIKKQKIQSISEIAVNGIVKDARYKDVSKELHSIDTNFYLLVGNNQFSALRSKEKFALKKLLPNLVIKTIKGGHELLNENNSESIAFISDVL